MLWLQYIGFTNREVGLLFSSSAGALFGGWLSATLRGWAGDAAWPLTAQISVALDIPCIWLVLMATPRSTDASSLYLGELFLFAVVATWCTPGCNRPIITEIVPPEVCGTILGVWIGIEGSLPLRFHSLNPCSGSGRF